MRSDSAIKPGDCIESANHRFYNGKVIRDVRDGKIIKHKIFIGLAVSITKVSIYKDNNLSITLDYPENSYIMDLDSLTNVEKVECK